MNTTTMLSVNDLHHAYTHAGVTEPVLHGVDLTLQRGEFVVIMGPSGCGKSTLLNILGLMLAPTRAQQLFLAGQDALKLSDAQRTRLRRTSIGFVFQRFNLLPTISARQNVMLPLWLRGDSVDGQVDDLLNQVGLLPHARKKPAQLSVGQQQRVAIARALVARPALLLADEPTGNLDSANAEGILDLLRRFHREWGQTILMITHSTELTAGAHRVLHMRDGKFLD